MTVTVPMPMFVVMVKGLVLMTEEFGKGGTEVMQEGEWMVMKYVKPLVSVTTLAAESTHLPQ